jgi:hypothetical protein
MGVDEPAEIPLHFAVPVWGASYVKTFCEFSVPMLVSPGNLGSLTARPTFTIYTTKNDEAVLGPAIGALSLVADVRLEFIVPSDNKDELIGACRQDASRHAAQEGAALFMLDADIHFEDGFVLSVQKSLSRSAGTRRLECDRAFCAKLKRESPSAKSLEHDRF